MKKKRHTPEQIITKLRKVERLTAEGLTVREAVKQIEVSEQTYYRWRREYGGMEKNQVKQLKGLQKENARLKKLVAEQALDITILKEVAEGNSGVDPPAAFLSSISRDIERLPPGSLAPRISFVEWMGSSRWAARPAASCASSPPQGSPPPNKESGPVERHVPILQRDLQEDLQKEALRPGLSGPKGYRNSGRIGPKKRRA